MRDFFFVGEQVETYSLMMEWASLNGCSFSSYAWRTGKCNLLIKNCYFFLSLMFFGKSLQYYVMVKSRCSVFYGEFVHLIVSCMDCMDIWNAPNPWNIWPFMYNELYGHDPLTIMINNWSISEQLGWPDDLQRCFLTKIISWFSHTDIWTCILQ